MHKRQTVKVIIIMKNNVVLRLIRNLVIVILSIGWVEPLRIGIKAFLSWMYHSHQPGYLEEIDCGLAIDISKGFISLGLVWLGIVIAFWIFVLANKLWPIKNK